MGHSIHNQCLNSDNNSAFCDQKQKSYAVVANDRHPNRIAVSKRLELRYYRSEDIARIFESYTGDLSSAKYLARRPHTEVEQTETMLLHFSVPESMALTGKCIWVVDAISEGEGAIGLVTIVNDNDSMAVHFGIGRPYRGRGYAAEALLLTAQYLLATGQATSVNSFTDVENVVAQMALEKAGFIYTTRTDKFYQAPQMNGEYRDVFHYKFRA
ncbi:GNAT family N-acetyltransferase [Halomonas sp. ISL-60]|uniref:GNAT family N-acetyltransferase n=1 Tax=Halomonas sp. ISL-56 TaxID=2819149 RepID=UPI001BE93C68|nr:GNAT family N-acetyltransferase [Halomonas sp. ISL-56]MBT2773717.1 GNAT family N-acetyltransferase [Halomonas sp. ISL-60]MBT2803216.1 GNAT family N-acetyltransferase [Halomonas sp. ISL-56]